MILCYICQLRALLKKFPLTMSLLGWHPNRYVRVAHKKWLLWNNVWANVRWGLIGRGFQGGQAMDAEDVHKNSI